MLVVKILMWPKGDESQERELGRTYIYNDGGTYARRNYQVRVCRKGSFTPKGRNLVEGKDFTRIAELKNHASNAYNVWILVLRALRNAFPEER